jgi:hypothetical protein
MDKQQLLTEISALPVRERAAALAHLAYTLTAQRVGWELRVPERWVDLSTEAKQFNLASADTWAQEPDLLDAWDAAIRTLCNDMRAQS